MKHVLFPEGFTGKASCGDQGFPAQQPGQKTLQRVRESSCWIFLKDVYGLVATVCVIMGHSCVCDAKEYARK